MKKHILTAVLFIAFAVFTVCVKFVDVQPIGPLESNVGFSWLNSAAIKAFGAHESWDKITDVFLVIALAEVLGFAILGLVQLIKRKSLLKVDAQVLALGITYVAVAIFYVLFEFVIINYRPVLEDGKLSASFPSSHVLITLMVFGSAIPAIKQYCKNSMLKLFLIILSVVLITFTTIGRLVCGVHWATDILGAILLAIPLILTSEILTAEIGKNQAK